MSVFRNYITFIDSRKITKMTAGTIHRNINMYRNETAGEPWYLALGPNPQSPIPNHCT